MSNPVAESLYNLVILELVCCIVGVFICFVVFFIIIIAVSLIIRKHQPNDEIFDKAITERHEKEIDTINDTNATKNTLKMKKETGKKGKNYD